MAHAVTLPRSRQWGVTPSSANGNGRLGRMTNLARLKNEEEQKNQFNFAIEKNQQTGDEKNNVQNKLLLFLSQFAETLKAADRPIRSNPSPIPRWDHAVVCFACHQRRRAFQPHASFAISYV